MRRFEPLRELNAARDGVSLRTPALDYRQDGIRTLADRN
jgi:hypothetical protein